MLYSKKLSQKGGALGIMNPCLQENRAAASTGDLGLGFWFPAVDGYDKPESCHWNKDLETWSRSG